MGFRPYGGIYSPFGYDPRNDPQDVPAANPLPAEPERLDTGNAGADGYTVLSRANRFGERPFIGGTPEYNGPHPEDY